jgi:hypothetical protein
MMMLHRAATRFIFFSSSNYFDRRYLRLVHCALHMLAAWQLCTPVNDNRMIPCIY